MSVFASLLLVAICVLHVSYAEDSPFKTWAVKLSSKRRLEQRQTSTANRTASIDYCIPMRVANGISFPVLAGTGLNYAILLQAMKPNGATLFRQDWDTYKHGFGLTDLQDNFWFGLESMHQLTTLYRSYGLLIQIQRTNGQWYWAHYQSFSVGAESPDWYQLTVTGYRGNAGDAFNNPYEPWASNGASFSTFDADHDNYPSGNCAAGAGSGWWWNWCSTSCLNYNNRADWYIEANTGGDVIQSLMFAIAN